MPKKYCRYRDALRASMGDALRGLRESAVGDVKFGIKAVFFRRTNQRTDVDNLLKSLCDAGTGVVWKDDSQIVEQYGRTFFRSEDPRVVILIYEVDDLPFEIERRTSPCARCGKPMEASADWKRRKYCSIECKTPRVIAACARCGEGFEVPAGIQKQRPQKYCTRECYIEASRGKPKKRVEAKVPKLCCDCGEVLPNQKSTRCRPCYTQSKAGSKTSPYNLIKKKEY